MNGMTETYREQRRLYSVENYIIFCKAHKMHVQLYYYNNIGTRKIALLFLLVILIDLTDPSSQFLRRYLGQKEKV